MLAVVIIVAVIGAIIVFIGGAIANSGELATRAGIAIGIIGVGILGVASGILYYWNAGVGGEPKHLYSNAVYEVLSRTPSTETFPKEVFTLRDGAGTVWCVSTETVEGDGKFVRLVKKANEWQLEFVDAKTCGVKAEKELLMPGPITTMEQPVVKKPPPEQKK